MRFDIQKNPVGLLQIFLEKGESIVAEGGAMVYLKGDIEIKTRMRKGGFLRSLKVAALGSESFFVNDYVAKENGCSIGLTGPPIGDIIRIPVSSSDGYIIQSGGYVCSTPGIDIDTQWQGFTKGIFGSDLFMLKATGDGDVFVNAYGGIIEQNLGPGEKIIIDNYHLVALSLNTQYEVRKFGGLKSTILGGEGFVTEVTGPAKVYTQTKNLKELIDILGIRGSNETTHNVSNMRNFSIGGFKLP